MNHAYAKKAYKSNQVTTAPKKKLLLMLYDGAIKNLRLAEIALQEKKIEQVNHNLIKTQDIISELMATLNFEVGGKVAENLYQLYDYMNWKLMQSNIKKDTKGIVEVKKYLEELRESWAQL